MKRITASLAIILSSSLSLGIEVVNKPVYAWPPRLSSCGPNMAGTYGESRPIPGDPNNAKGWFDEEQVDAAGNKLQVWCIDRNDGVGNSYGLRYVPAGGNPVWLGRCAFKGGNNFDGKEATGTDKKGNPLGWKKIKWTSEDDGGGGGTDPKDDDGQPGKRDFDWEYHVETNTLKRWETKDGKRINPEQPDFEGPPPTDFEDLFADSPNPEQDDKAKATPIVYVDLFDHAGDFWNYALYGNLTEFSPTTVYNQDKWSIWVAGVTEIFSPNENWIAELFEDGDIDRITWEYIGQEPLIITNSEPLDGFSFNSDQPFGVGTVNWLSDSFDDELANFGYNSTVEGPRSMPVPEPSSDLPLLALGTLGAGSTLLRKKKHKSVINQAS